MTGAPVCHRCGRPTGLAGIKKCLQCVKDARLSQELLDIAARHRAEREVAELIERAKRTPE